MKKNIVDYYALLMMILFILYNLVLNNLKIGGFLYQIFMICLIISNIIILIKFRKRIMFKELIVIVYFFTWLLLSKNCLQCIFSISSMITLIIIGFMESNFIKIISILIVIFFVIFAMPLFFVYLLAFGTSISEEQGRNDIYENMHYFCENDFEVYAYSAGAMDRFHYSVGKHYEFLDVDDIIYISYNERNEVTKGEYDDFLTNHKCKLVGDINGSK